MMEITNNYSSYAMQNVTGNGMAGSTKKKETEKATETAENGKSKSTAAYMSELAKLVPSVELKAGNGFSSEKTGKTLTIHPQLLEKMQNDPEKEKETKELIKGVETAVNLLDSVMNASGWTVVSKHGYIDENGKYRQIALVRNDFMLNMSDKLREERRENAEKLIEKSKEKTNSNQNYLAKLQEKVSYLELEQGFGLSTKRDNRVTLMIHPKLLEKMQNDPEAEKRYTQTIKDIERAERTATAYYNALGGCVERSSHWYIDENGKYCHFAYTRRDDKLNERLREEAKENAEKQIQKTRENAREKAKQLTEKLEEKAEAQTIVETIKENETEQTFKKSAGMNFDIII